MASTVELICRPQVQQRVLLVWNRGGFAGGPTSLACDNIFILCIGPLSWKVSQILVDILRFEISMVMPQKVIAVIENIPCHATLFQCHTHEWRMLALKQTIKLGDFCKNLENIDDPIKNQVEWDKQVYFDKVSHALCQCHMVPFHHSRQILVVFFASSKKITFMHLFAILELEKGIIL